MKFHDLDVFGRQQYATVGVMCNAGVEVFNSAAALMHGEIAFGCSLDKDSAVTR